MGLKYTAKEIWKPDILSRFGSTRIQVKMIFKFSSNASIIPKSLEFDFFNPPEIEKIDSIEVFCNEESTIF